MEEEAGVASTAGEVGGVNDAICDNGGQSTGVVDEEEGGVALGASGGASVNPALEDAVGEGDTIGGIGGKEGAGVASCTDVSSGVVYGALGRHVGPGNTSVVGGGVPEPSGTRGATEGVRLDDGAGLVVGVTVGDYGEGHAKSLCQGGKTKGSPLTDTVNKS